MVNDNHELLLELWSRVKSHVPPKERLEVADIFVVVFDEFADAVAMGASMGIQDYSRKEVDDFGNYEIVERAFAKRADWDVLIPRARTDLFINTLASLRARPALYIGGTKEDATSVYGFPRDFGIVIEYPLHTQCSVELEGLI